MTRFVMTGATFSLVLAVALRAQAPPDLKTGQKIFESQCALCHGQTGTGGRGPSLVTPVLNRAPDDDSLRKLISNGIEPEMPAAWQLNPRETASVAVYVRSLGAIAPEPVPGNPTRGAELYRQRGCAGCHIIHGDGEGFGPELSGIGAKRNAAHLRKTLLEPGESLPEGFTYLSLKPAGSSTVRGILVNEDSFTVQVKDGQGRFHSFRKSELQELRRLLYETPMPSYRDKLAAAELDDLVCYLAGLRGPK